MANSKPHRHDCVCQSAPEDTGKADERATAFWRRRSRRFLRLVRSWIRRPRRRAVTRCAQRGSRRAESAARLSQKVESKIKGRGTPAAIKRLSAHTFPRHVPRSIACRESRRALIQPIGVRAVCAGRCCSTRKLFARLPMEPCRTREVALVYLPAPGLSLRDTVVRKETGGMASIHGDRRISQCGRRGNP